MCLTSGNEKQRETIYIPPVRRCMVAWVYEHGFLCAWFMSIVLCMCLSGGATEAGKGATLLCSHVSGYPVLPLVDRVVAVTFVTMLGNNLGFSRSFIDAIEGFQR